FMTDPVLPTADRDERLAKVLAEMTENARHGKAPGFELLQAQHPDLADELRELWATAQFVDEFATRSAPLAAPLTPAIPAGPLPRTFGDYALLEEIGRGGMGIVYKAHQKSLERVVALKMILRGDLATPADRARFQTEGRAAGTL